MSLKATNLVRPNTYEIEIESTAEEFESAVESTYRKNRGRINVPGFRKGKAPRKMIEKLYGETVFYDDAINSMVPTVVAPAVEETKLELVGRPEIDVTSISRENGVAFKVTVTVKPEVKVEGYKGIKIEKYPEEVTDKDVENAILEERKKNARIIAAEDREAQDGDTVNIDFKGFVDGEQFEGGTEEGYDLKLGSKAFIPGFEDQIVGKKAGEEFSINVTFPENYQMEEIAGKEATFEIKLNSVSYEELPEADDEFAQDISEFDTLDELKADIRSKLTEGAAKRAKSINTESMFAELAKLVEGDIPEVMYEEQIDRYMSDFERRLKAQNLTTEIYYAFSGQDEKAVRAQYKDAAEKSVKVSLALEYIAKAENLEVSAEELEKEVAEIAENAKVPVDRVKQLISLDVVKNDLLMEKAKDLCMANVEYVEKKEEADSAAEKTE